MMNLFNAMNVVTYSLFMKHIINQKLKIHWRQLIIHSKVMNWYFFVQIQEQLSEERARNPGVKGFHIWINMKILKFKRRSEKEILFELYKTPDGSNKRLTNIENPSGDNAFGFHYERSKYKKFTF
jgi:hypothetical protein